MPPAPRKPQESSAPPLATAPVQPAPHGDAKVPLALLWLLLFCGLFFQFDLPNSNPPVNRSEILQAAPTLLVDLADPPPPIRPDRSADPLEQFQYRQELDRYRMFGWKNFPQRLPYIAWGSLILMAAWSLGRLLFRSLAWPELITTGEKNYLAVLVGASTLSLLVLLAGLAGFMQQTLWIAFLVGLIAIDWHLTLRTLPSISSQLLSTLRNSWWKFLPFLPFAICYLLAALLPEMDFDAREYHLGGPKEWFQLGRIVFLPHDVYTSFPFLAEMFILLGMIVTGDWYWGILPGKFLLVSLAPITAWGLYLAGKRWFSPTVGWLAAFFYFSTPWVYRFSTLTGVEGALTTYLCGTLIALLLLAAVRMKSAPRSQLLTLLLTAGFLAGSGMACKYPGLVSVVIPAYLGLIALSLLQVSDSPSQPFLNLFTALSVFTLGVALAIGPWLLKNTAQTGNPVYPLGYTIFGGTDWSPELNEKWRAGHSSRFDRYTLGWFGESIKDVTMKSDWQSPLFFSLAPLALLIVQNRRLIVTLWILVFYQFLTYWFLTHRIDRFWVPLIPLVALLAARGFKWSNHPAWKWTATLVVVVVSAYHLALIPLPYCGYNAYLLDYKAAAEETTRINNPDLIYLHERLTPQSKVLFVGEAQLFDYRYPYEYNTVFDFSLLEQWTAQPAPGKLARDLELRPVEEIREVFKEHGITHICVNWKEILRYRLTYRYSDFVNRERILQLQKLGLLGPPLPDTGVQPFNRLSPDEQAEIRVWSPALIFEQGPETMIHTFEVFPVTLD